MLSQEEGQNRGVGAGYVSGDIAIIFEEGESWWQRGRQTGCVCTSDLIYFSMLRRDPMYCIAGSQSTTYGSGSSTTWLAQAQALLCRVTAWGSQGSCCPQHWLLRALCIAGCAEMGRVVIQSWRERRSALAPPNPAAGTSSGGGPAAPVALNRPL